MIHKMIRCFSYYNSTVATKKQKERREKTRREKKKQEIRKKEKRR